VTHKMLIDVGSYHLYMESAGGGPTVIFESGMGCGAESLANLAAEVQQFTRVVLYDRAGLGQSDPAPKPRTSQDVVDDLWQLLQQAQIDGPYLLVGHSFAGYHLRLFAHQHPQAVAGLVLLDASHPDQTLRELQLLPPPSPNEPAAITKARETLTAEWNDPFRNEEGMDIAASAAQVRATSHLGQLPLVVITAGIDEWEDGFPPEIAHASAANWLAMQKELVALSHNSTHIIATESDHSIQDCQPELVVDVIRQLVQEIQGHPDQPGRETVGHVQGSGGVG
jgi:pimeloyl-ACP methyl ester carboxylesterase